MQLNLTNSDRNERLLAELKALTSELSGHEEQDLAPDLTFLELGFDSLFLTQLATAFQKEFAVPVTFRQLFSDVPTLNALAGYLLTQRPELGEQQSKAATASPQPAPQAMPQAQPMPQAQLMPPAQPVVAAPHSLPPLPQTSPFQTSTVQAGPVQAGAVQPSDGMMAVFSEQLQLMQQQIAMLQQNSLADPRPVSMPQQMAQPQPVEPAAAACAPVAEGKTDAPAAMEDKPALPKGFAINVSTKLSKDTLSPSQLAHIERLTARYNAKTANSKQRTQADRDVHADPRTAAGFNPLWKELVYPITVERSKGAYLWDVDGNRYIDMLNGFGPNFFGHNAAFINDALKAQLDDSYEVGPQTPRAGETSRLFCELTGMDRVSWVNTGSEAVQAAIRISRTVTGRDKIVVFSGDYHGNFDEVLVRGTKSAKGRRSLPMAPGIPFNSVDNIIVLDYGEMNCLQEIEAQAGEIAAVLVEPVQSRRPELQPRAFLHELRALTEKTGIVLIFDEVITGFRTGPGGAQEFFGVEADIATYGKVIGGGMPIGVVAGRKKFMDTFDGGMWGYGDDSRPTAGVTYFAGTFVRHPLAIAAAHASLSHLKAAGPALQEEVTRKAKRLADALNQLFEEQGVAIEVPRFGSLMFIRNKEENELATLFYYHMRDRGIHLLEGFPTYMTAAHTEEDVDRVIEAARDSIFEMQADEILPAPPERRQEIDQWVRRYPLTEDQASVWFACTLSPELSCAYNESDTLEILGPLDAEKFVEAVSQTLQNHEAFALRFDSDGLEQYVDRNAAYAVERIDLRTEGEDSRQAMETYIAALAGTPFDLVEGPLYKAALLQLANERYVFVFFCHHIVYDGYSGDILLQETAARYRAALSGQPAEIAANAPFSVYVLNEQRSERHPAYQKALAYWRETFADGVPELPELPTDRPRGKDIHTGGSTHYREINPALLPKLKQAAASAGFSLNTLLFSAYAALLGRLSGQEDFVLGLPYAGQSDTGIETIGFCANTLPIRTRPALERPFADLARETQDMMLGAMEHRVLAISAIARELNAPRQENRLPITEILFNYSHYFADLDLPGCSVKNLENKRTAVHHDLFINVIETAAQLEIYLDYCSDLFDEASISYWTELYVEMLEEIADAPDIQLSELLSDNRALSRIGATREYPGEPAPVLQQFEKAAAAHAAKPAVICASESTSYEQLQHRATQVASLLLKKKTAPGAFVGVMQDRSSDLIATVLGIWKAGCAYLPLDPEFPDERLRYMLENSGATIVIADEPASRRDELLQAFTVLTPDELDETEPASKFPAIAASSAAYILYTSGSTGTPKGVVNSHAALAHFLAQMQQSPGLAERDVLLAITTLSFDISLLELFLPLVTGATLVLAESDDAYDGFILADLIRDHQVTVMQGTPANWRLLLDSDFVDDDQSHIKALCGGEPLTRIVAEQLLDHVGELWNMYGPTETTVWSSCKKITSADEITVGAPIGGATVYIVDRLGQLLPKGVIGELWIGGDVVAMGYHNRPDLTEAKFIDDPFQPGGRVYKTGDRGRLLDNGEIQLLGRNDHQLKIRGYRIEPGDIEKALEKHSAVAQAAINVLVDAAGEKLLIAYVVYNTEDEPTGSELRQWLRQSLPGYMIPQHFIPLEEMPLTPTKKVDRRALPEPDLSAGRLASERVAPRTEMETRIASIWEELLEIDDISVRDNFLELGGQSLQVASMAATLRKRHGYRIAPRAVIFETLEQLASSAERC